jgi:hypothetical protein
MTQYAGMPEDTSNRRELPCGCVLLRVALRGNPEVYQARCSRHIDTHAEWCRHLSSRGQLDYSHIGCKNANRCVSAPARDIQTKMRRDRDR